VTPSIPRTPHLASLRAHLDEFPVVGLVGPRQTGKSTALRQLAASWPDPAWHFDMEDSRVQARLSDPILALDGLRGLVVLDEVQRAPALFPALRVLADRPGRPASFVVSGSASPHMLRLGAESLAGRIHWHELPGLSLDEIDGEADRLWLRGGYPRAFLAPNDGAAARYVAALTRAHIERDLPDLGFRLPRETTRRFFTMVAHLHGDRWNGAELARAFGVAESTVRHHLDMLSGSLLLRRLRPWFTNTGKREVKAPKVYLSDTGLLHHLLGIRSAEDLLSHPKVGASWEGFAIEQVTARLGVERDACWFWAVHSGAELDLLVVRGRRRWGFEVKRTSSPTLTPSIRSALEVLAPERIDIVHAGPDTFPLAPRVRALALSRLRTDLGPLDP
jgi:predicted AAA+ superfamily ATPase